jgi:glutamine amidotransferase
VSGVAIVAAGGANFASVRIALARLGVRARLTADPARIAAASRVILPGVGAAAAGMAALRDAGLVDVLRGLRQPLLGICLGMQLLHEHSDEGDVACLGLLPGRVARLPRTGPRIRVPHMGWNRLRHDGTDPLLRGVADGAEAYFVHGYGVPVGAATVARCEHGAPFAAVVRRGPVAGVQFHPERSGPVGARVLRNFLEGDGA